MTSKLKSKIYTEAIEIVKDDIDILEHVNNKVYLKWMENISWKHSLAVGINKEVFLKVGKLMVIKKHELNYKRPLFEGDKVEMITWVDAPINEFERIRHYQVRKLKDETIIFEAHTSWVCVDIKRQRKTTLPKELNEPYFE
jgi:acyl-CoA thioester hydrolase